MPSNLTKDVVYNVPAETIKAHVMGLPQHVDKIHFVSENALTNSIKLFFDQGSQSYHNNVELSLTPISESQTKVIFNSTYANGDEFEKDLYVNNALVNVQNALDASLNGLIVDFKLQPVSIDAGSTIWGIITLVVAFFCIYIGFKACMR